MKKLFLPFLILATTAVYAQPKLITQATINTTTNVIAPEEDDVAQIQPQGEGGGRGGFNFRNMMDGESKSTTFIKNDLVKTNLKSESYKGSIYRNNTTKTTTTVMEMMGSKIGIVGTDDDQVIMKKRADSMMAERAKTDTNMKQRRVRNVNFEVSLLYVNETKKIAGYECKKALLITDKLLTKDTMAVWYTPEVKFTNVSSTGGVSGIPMARNFGGGGVVNFDKVDGFVMMYTQKMPRGRVMEVAVTKIEINKDIADKEFDIPKDIEYRNMKDMGGPGGGRFFGR
jgi:GLPGLI family protein